MHDCDEWGADSATIQTLAVLISIPDLHPSLVARPAGRAQSGPTPLMGRRPAVSVLNKLQAGSPELMIHGIVSAMSSTER